VSLCREARYAFCADLANGWPPVTMTSRDLLPDDSIPAGAAGPARSARPSSTPTTATPSIERTSFAIASRICKIIIVDNGSEPETLDSIRSAAERDHPQACELLLNRIDYEYCAQFIGWAASDDLSKRQR
jgi:hypothetical protein